MCFVLDVNCFHCMFDEESREQEEFRPLKEWLYNHPGTCLVIGGSTYLQEVGRLGRYLGMLAELDRSGKLRRICSDVVDHEEERVKAEVKAKGFDDAHIVGIFRASGCLLFASRDKRADCFIKKRELYPKGQKRPNIYRYAKQAKRLLCDDNIVRLRNTV